MADAKGGDDSKRPIYVIKKIKKGGGHHGGAWKVAYADFVTAMMAFFLLLWLLNATTKEQKEGISNYFDPTPQISQSQSGAGGMLGGLSMATQGSQSSSLNNPMPNLVQAQPTLAKKMAEPDLEKVKKEKLKAEIKKREEDEFKKAKEKIEQALNENPDLKALAKNIVVDMTPEGLRIQIVDQEGKAMFNSGSAEMFDETRKLMEMVAGVVKGMPNQVSIRGHTDSAQYKAANGYGNWELSSDRANASRQALLSGGLDEKRIANVVGKADTEHFTKDNPLDPRNRRISIILLHDQQTKQPGANATTPVNSQVSDDEDEEEETTDTAPADPGYQKTPGAVQFP